MEKMHKDKLNQFYHRRVVVDSSVLVKGFFTEQESELTDELFVMSKSRKTTILAPTLIIYEFLNVLTRKIHDKGVISKILLKLKKLNISILPLEKTAVLKAIELCGIDPKISFYDAAYHAMAKDMNAIFLTADEKYYNSAKKRGNIKLLSQI